MTMRMLLDEKFDDYFEAAGQKNTLWVNQHVPKTAGSSLRRELADELWPNANIHLDGTDPSVPYHERLDIAVGDFLKSMKKRPYKLASGHIFARHVATIDDAAPHAKFITFLRDPTARFISDYRYQRTPMSPGHERFRQDFPTIESFMTLPWTRNQISNYLLPKDPDPAGDADRAVDFLLDRFEFIGLQEDYDLSFQALARRIGFNRKPTHRVRENPDSSDNPTAMTSAQMRQIAEANAFDHAIVERIRARFNQIRQPLSEWLARMKLPAA